MAGQAVDSRPVSISDFELVEKDSGDSGGPGGTAISSSVQIHLWIDPATIKLKHRIGRGPFGDVWLATHHRSAEDYEEHHEVAIKMLHSVKEDDVKDILVKLDNLLSKCRDLEDIFWPHGVSIISKKICIVMKFYEGSVGDKMARLKGGKLSLNDVLRYGADLAQGVMDLHSKEILLLNLKPSNFLLNENDRAILGDIGLAYVLLGASTPTTAMIRRLGTPNYMAPEQWQPEVTGPLSLETDSWGFACSIVEMLTGIQPWSGKSINEIHELVVKKQEKPHIPSGLPPAVENVIIGCFEYDFMSRPMIADILHAFKSSLNAVSQDGGWTGLGSRIIREKVGDSYYTDWFLAKDHLQVGDMVRSRRKPDLSKPQNMDVVEGSVAGLECDTDRNGLVLVRMHGLRNPIKVQASKLERVTFGLAAGDWVLLKKEDKKHSPMGILHSINRDGNAAVGFIGLKTLWKGNYSELQKAKPYCVGQFVRPKSNVLSPRFEWPWRRGGEWAAGRICRILPNGCLAVDFPGKLTFCDENKSCLADPAEVELVSFDTCQGMVKKYQHLEDFHWAVRPMLMALGLFTAMKLGIRVGRQFGRAKVKKGHNPVTQNDGQTGENTGWRPPKVAKIFG